MYNIKCDIMNYLGSFSFRFGTKHIVATNIILWLRTLIKESVEEIIELQEESTDYASLVNYNIMPKEM